jgi:hypothetical protein
MLEQNQLLAEQIASSIQKKYLSLKSNRHVVI